VKIVGRVGWIGLTFQLFQKCVVLREKQRRTISDIKYPKIERPKVETHPKLHPDLLVS